MTTYKIKSTAFCAAVIVAGPTVIQAPPVLEAFVCRPFEQLRDACEKRGWIIEPMAIESVTDWIEYGGKLYEFVYDSPQQLCLRRITVYEEGEALDVTWKQLPYPLSLMI